MTAGALSFIHGNALALSLADRSVHLVVTSPPYFALRAYQDRGEWSDGQLGSEATPHQFLANLWAVLDECWRVLRDDGSCWVNLGDKYTGSGGHNNAGVGGTGRGPSSYNQNTGGLRPKSRMLLPHRFALGLIDPDYRRFAENQGRIIWTDHPPQWICRMDAVWAKPNGLPESVTDRVRASHEYWLHFTKSERYYSALDEIREDYDPKSLERYKSTPLQELPAERRAGKGDGYIDGNRDANPLGKAPGSVWTVATEPLKTPEYWVAAYPGQLEPRWMTVKEARRWMFDTGLTSSPWPQQPEDGRQLRAAPSHFAAFPSEFPRRLILGWSPSGICTACGEGRRPVCEKDYRTIHVQKTDRRTLSVRTGGETLDADKRPHGVAAAEVSITGTACGCPTPTAPTTPARILDPFSGTGTTAIVAAALGRHGIGVDLSWDYHRIAQWRHADGALRAKALGVDRPERQLAGQLDLFEAQ